MPTIHDWQRNREMWVRILKKQTGESVSTWNERIREASIEDERRLRTWLSAQGVSGYAQSLLVMERFGYPDFILATADELIEKQYSDRAHLRPIYDAIIIAAERCGEFSIQTRKTYVSLVSPQRTFARVQPTTKTRVDLGLRLNERKAQGRLQPSRIHETMRFRIGLRTRDEVDGEVLRWLKRAYNENS